VKVSCSLALVASATFSSSSPTSTCISARAALRPCNSPAKALNSSSMAAAILALVAPDTGVASLVVGGLGVAWLLNWAATLSKEELLVGGIALAEGFSEGTTAAT